MKKYSIILLSVLLSCVEPLEVEVSGNGSSLLVVEGGIDTDFGPHIVELTRSAKYGSIFDGFIQREANATVSVRDNTGEVTFLTEELDGVYMTDPSFKAVIGNSYTLQIITDSGIMYNSIPEKISAVVGIDSAYAIYEEQPTSNPLQLRTGMQVYADFKDPEGVDNYYYWTTSGTFQVNANPELHLDEYGGPDPLDCCSKCWANEVNNSPNVLRDNTFDGTDITQAVSFIEDNGIRYGDKYFITVKQRSLSFEGYSFYQLVSQQLSIDGDIFDPPPATVRGNVINLSDPNENVIGFFTASDVRTKSMFITPGQVLNLKPPTLIRDDCRNFSNSSTVIKPSFWL